MPKLYILIGGTGNAYSHQNLQMYNPIVTIIFRTHCIFGERERERERERKN
jgi:hypothetical protein